MNKIQNKIFNNIIFLILDLSMYTNLSKSLKNIMIFLNTSNPTKFLDPDRFKKMNLIYIQNYKDRILIMKINFRFINRDII